MYSPLIKLTTDNLKSIYLPQILRLNNTGDKQAFLDLNNNNSVSFVHDEIYGQLQELVKSQHPSVKLQPKDYERLINEHLDGQDITEYGVWVYYPWSQRLVHLLDEEEFVEVRTNRNRYKITREEQESLRKRKIGVIGLSVGHSIALTLAMERTCGELRLADFDTAELSNLNRIRTSSFNLGLNKTVIAAREILEIDPFIKVKIFNDGLSTENMDGFFLKDGKLDLLVEVCDGLNIKIQSRYKARELQIPVVMDTNDRGMLDVERFDLDPQRPVLHGLADGLDPETIKDLTNEQKIPYILRMIGIDSISTRLKASMLEVEQSINTWPQLASSVTLGGALTTDVCRRILLDQYHESGRYYIDLEELVKDEEPKKQKQTSQSVNPYQALQITDLENAIEAYFKSNSKNNFALDNQQLNKIIDAALIAPSAGNNQPWKWVYHKDVLFLFHDKFKSWSWGDYYEMGSHMALGAAIENIHIQAAALGLQDEVELFPIKQAPTLTAAIHFSKSDAPVKETDRLFADHLFTRNTNRRVGKRELLPHEFFEHLQSVINETGTLKMSYTDREDDLNKLAEIIAECDKVRLLNKQGHEEFYHEIRWDKEEAQRLRDGVEIDSVDISKSDVVGFRVASDWNAVKLLSEWKQGSAFKKLSLKAVKAASAIIVFSVSEFSHTKLIQAGRSIQKAWIQADIDGVSVHPMLSPAFFFTRLIHGKGEELAPDVAENLKALRNDFLKIFPLESNGESQTEVFLMKVSKAEPMGTKSLRKHKEEVFLQF